MPKTRASLWIIAATTLTVAMLFLLPFTPRIAVRTAEITQGDLLKTDLMEGVVSYESQLPCVAMQSGLVREVYVQQGQSVKAGELLFSLDASAEEQALQAMVTLRYEQQQALENFPEAKAAFAADTMEALQKEQELRAAIALKQVRAQADGVVSGVYAAKGDAVSAMSVLGVVRDEQKCITAAHRMVDNAELAVGTVAEMRASTGASLGAAALQNIGAPTVEASTSQALQTLRFTPISEDALVKAEVGERVVLELLTETHTARALAPIAAVDRNDRLWVVRDGHATPIIIDPSERNAQYVSVSADLLGERIILSPDDYSLYAGCPVKEAKKR